VPRERTHAIHHGPGHLAALEVASPCSGELDPQSEPYALFVGTLEPRKNLGTLLEAFGRLRADVAEGGRAVAEAPELVLCGARGWKTEQLEAALESGRRGGWLRVLGYVPDPELVRWYRGARMVLCPSLYEGFGLPLVEAMWAGAPLVCSDIPVFREVGGDAALYVEPESVTAWCEAVLRVWQSAELRTRLSAAGRRRLAEFDWNVAAERTFEVWQGLARDQGEAAMASGGQRKPETV
jgi:alpha-1,3-rhamnosyl/mannosyltransferase